MTETVTLTEEPARLNRRQIAKASTAAKVLASAKVEFETKGYAKAVIRNIAKGANMSTGAIFANYQDKEALYVAAYGHKPITPELGRAAMIALRALGILSTGEPDYVDELDAVDVLRRHADDLLHTAGFPELAIKFDEEETCSAFVKRALQTWAKGLEA